ncbi:unnamed protein product [Penicillium salamii]|nr:unnamed protein product [Penicillium salamii]
MNQPQPFIEKKIYLQHQKPRFNNSKINKPLLSTLILSRITLPPDLSLENNSILYTLQTLTLQDYPNQLYLLQSLSQLQHLNLKLSNFPTSKSHIENTIKHHHTTLKSLIYYKYQLTPINKHSLFKNNQNISPIWITDLSSIIDLTQITTLTIYTNPFTIINL